MKKNSKKQTINPLGRLASFFAVAILIVSTFIGAIFGFHNAVKNRGPLDDITNQNVEFQTKVKLSGETNIKDVAYSINQTLNFLGEHNSQVFTIGNEGLKVVVPVSSYQDAKTDNDSLIELISDIENNKKYITEVEKLIVASFFNGGLDFRTTKGTPIFIKPNNKWEFNAEIAADEGGEEGGENKNNKRTSIEDFPQPQVNFFSKAKLKYSGGTPSIELTPKTRMGKDQYINMFKDWSKYYKTTKGNLNEKYVVWFDYDRLEYLASKLDENYEEDVGLYETYIKSDNAPGWARPFYVTVGEADPLSSKYAKKVSLIGEKGKLTDSEAKYFVYKINNNNSYKFSSLSIRLVMKEKSSVMLLTMSILFIVMIVVVMFLLSWYFGLLGMLSSSIFLLSTLFLALILSFAGIVVTGIGLLTLIIASMFNAMFFFTATKTYKENNEDKFMSVFSRFNTKFREYNKMTFAPTILFLVLMYVAGLFLPTVISITLFIFVIGMTISYVLSILVQLPSLFLIDWMTEFTFQEFNGKWNVLTGQNKKIIKKDLQLNIKNVDKKTQVLSITTLLVALFAGLMAGILTLTTGNATNTNLYGTRDFQYDVVYVGKEKKINLLKDGENDGNGNDGVFMSRERFEETKNKKDKVLEVFKDNGVKINSTSIVRNDEFNISEKLFLSSFGYIVYSNKEISNNEFKDINTALKTASYMITKSGSLINGTENVSRIKNYTFNNSVIGGIIVSVIFIVIVGLFVLLLNGWGVSMAVMISTLFETIFIIVPFFILFLPYSIFVWVPVIMILGTSSLLKIRVIQSVRKDANKTEDIWKRNSKGQMFLVPTIGVTFAIGSLLLIPIYGWLTILSLFLISIWSSFIVFIIQQITFPFFAKMMGDFRDKVTKNRTSDDIRKSKDSDKPKEEFIEGVNM